MVHLYLHGGHTMGDTLMAMCLFNSMNQPVHITTQLNSWYITWKRIFGIGDQITLDPVELCPTWINPPHFKHLESFKIFSRYDQFDHVNVFDQLLPVGRRGKKLAAVLINDGNHVKDSGFYSQIQDHTDPYPFIKFHSKQTYDLILNLIQSAGYDPVVLDTKAVSVDHKVFILNELCDFVIGYEGGMCHLAHTLKVPTIILPWRVIAGEHSMNDFLHLDKRTYLIRDLEELESWTTIDLKKLVEGLHHEVGYNNRWMVDPEFPDPTRFLDHFKSGSNNEFVKQVEWALPYFDWPRLGGY